MGEEKSKVASFSSAPFELTGLVTYHEGSVVSREIARKKGGTITVFAFDEGQGLSEHTAPFDALVMVLEGDAEIRVSGNTFSLKAGQSILMPAGSPHSLKAPSKFKMALIMVKDA